MNLRKDHYRYVSKVNFNVTYRVNGTQPFRGRPDVPLNGRPSLTRRSVSPAFVFFISNFVQSENNCATLKKVVTNEKKRETTFNGGSLGSRIDEERSQLR